MTDGSWVPVKGSGRRRQQGGRRGPSQESAKDANGTYCCASGDREPPWFVGRVHPKQWCRQCSTILQRRGHSRHGHQLMRPIPTLVVATAFGLSVLAPVAASQGNARQRILFVSAVSDDGMPLEALTPEDVVVREDG